MKNNCSNPTVIVGRHMTFKQFLYEYALVITQNQGQTNDDISSALSFVENAKNDKYYQALYVQAYHESGKFKSGLYVNYKNMFGMGAPNSRMLYCDVVKLTDNLTGAQQTFAVYDFPGKSIRDRIGWDAQKDDFVRPSAVASDVDIMNYYRYVQSHHYANDPSYFSKLYALYIDMRNSGIFDYGTVSPHANMPDGTTYTDDELDNMQEGQGIFNLFGIGWKTLLIGGLVIYFVGKKFLKKVF